MTQMTHEKRQELLDLYRNGADLLESCLSEVPEEAMHYKAGPERWSVHQIAFHVVDSDINSFMRLRKPVAEPGASVPVYDQDVWAECLHAGSMSRETALGLFRAYRAYNYEYLSAVSEKEWTQSIVHPEYGEMTLGNVLDLYANHVLWHTDHIERTVNAWRRSKAGETVDPGESLYVGPT